MKVVRRLLVLLPLSLLTCGVAAAQSPQQEMEAEAKKIFPTVFTKCGDDYFSKRIFRYPSGDAYIIAQHKNITPRAMSYSFPKNYEWKGSIRFQASLGRELRHGEAFARRGFPADKLDTWSAWRKPTMSPYVFALEKKDGVITVKPPANVGFARIDCSEVPPG